jgi:hypothetical protein
MPGLEKYGGLTRARHIHISVMPFLHVPLTTQLYFKDGPNRPGDPWAGHKPQLALNPRSDGKYLRLRLRIEFWALNRASTTAPNSMARDCRGGAVHSIKSGVATGPPKFLPVEPATT